MTYKWLSYYTINTYKAPCELNFVLPSIYMLKPWYPVLQNVTLLGNRILANLSLPGGASDKESTCQHRKCKRCQFDPWVGKILWRRKWQPAPVFFPVKFCGQRSLVSYSPWGSKEPGMTKQTHIHNMTYPFLRIRMKYAIYKWMLL